MNSPLDSYHLKEFLVTPEHLALLRRANVQWDGAEYGAPCIDPKRPYGNSNGLRDVVDIFYPGAEMLDSGKGFVYDDLLYPKKELDRLQRVHEETQVVLEIALRVGVFEVGWYDKPEWNVWVKR